MWRAIRDTIYWLGAAAIPLLLLAIVRMDAQPVPGWTPRPTATPAPTTAPIPTATPVPSPALATPTPRPTPAPTATPGQVPAISACQGIKITITSSDGTREAWVARAGESFTMTIEPFPRLTPVGPPSSTPAARVP